MRFNPAPREENMLEWFLAFGLLAYTVSVVMLWELIVHG